MPEEVDVSHELKDLLQRMLVKNPKDRISLSDIKVMRQKYTDIVTYRQIDIR